MPTFSRKNLATIVPLTLFQCSFNVIALANIIITTIVPTTIVATPTTAPVLQLDQMK